MGHRFPDGFLWGAATSAHQVEGGNTNNDWWARENEPGSVVIHAFPRDVRFLQEARDDDWLGVQAYTRTFVGPEGPLPMAEGVETTLSGREYFPGAVGVGLRAAAAAAPGVSLLVTENGIATADDDRRRVHPGALEAVLAVIGSGIEVRGYYDWSLLDNFESMSGFRPTFGLVAVDRTTFVRTVKPSARWLGVVARTNTLPARPSGRAVT